MAREKNWSVELNAPPSFMEIFHYPRLKPLIILSSRLYHVDDVPSGATTDTIDFNKAFAVSFEYFDMPKTQCRCDHPSLSCTPK